MDVKICLFSTKGKIELSTSSEFKSDFFLFSSLPLSLYFSLESQSNGQLWTERQRVTHFLREREKGGKGREREKIEGERSLEIMFWIENEGWERIIYSISFPHDSLSSFCLSPLPSFSVPFSISFSNQTGKGKNEENHFGMEINSQVMRMERRTGSKRGGEEKVLSFSFSRFSSTRFLLRKKE